LRRSFVVAMVTPVLGGAWPMHGLGAQTHGRLTFQCPTARHEDRTEITLTFALLSNRAHHDWRIRIWDEGDLVRRQVRRTDADGELRVRAVTRDRPGHDHLTAKARDLTNGVSVCAVGTTI
jgi:hypothetical protein